MPQTEACGISFCRYSTAYSTVAAAYHLPLALMKATAQLPASSSSL